MIIETCVHTRSEIGAHVLQHQGRSIPDMSMMHA